MSRAAVKAKQRARGRDRHLIGIAAKQTRVQVAQLAVDAEYARMEAHAAVDAMLARCDGCGLVQTAPAGCGETEWDVVGCVLCGSDTGTYAGELPHPNIVPSGTK